MNTMYQATATTQSDERQRQRDGRRRAVTRSLNVNETVDSDDDTEGHASINVNETVDSDDDE